ncbi:hypothetical protein C8Q77DRAFT_1138079 [Trametes polyzona]|nr:hypothetical protein C8Q77DRAFT_1138079 [Trametes polyzona]
MAEDRVVESVVNSEPHGPRTPFDDDDGDIIFQSADGVAFRLYKVILRKASSVFRDMLTLPDAGGTPAGEPQLVPLTEDADTLERLLRLVYPVERPAFKTLDELLPVMEAAKKYDIPVAANDTRRELEVLARKEPPLRAYAIACAHGMPDLARQSARLLVKEEDFLGLDALPPEIRHLPDALLAFARYRSRCRSALLNVLDQDHEWLRAGAHEHKVAYSRKGNPQMQNAWVWLRCQSGSCPSSLATFNTAWDGGWSTSSTTPRLWWVHYETAVKRTLMGGRLDGKGAVQKNLMETVLVECCETCAPHASAQLSEYALSLENRVERAIDDVSFEWPFAAMEEKAT